MNIMKAKHKVYIGTFNFNTGEMTIYRDINAACLILGVDKKDLIDKQILSNGLIITNIVTIEASKRGGIRHKGQGKKNNFEEI